MDEFIPFVVLLFSDIFASKMANPCYPIGFKIIGPVWIGKPALTLV
jgi:hypothetical protein